MARKAADEKALRDRIEADPAKKAAVRTGLGQDRRRQERSRAEILVPYSFLERGYAFDSRLFEIARDIVRLAARRASRTPTGLREYRESALESLEQELFSEAPTYPEFEKAKLARSFAFWKKRMPSDPMVERVLRGRTPEQAAADLVDGTRLASVKVRKALARGDEGDRSERRPDDQARPGGRRPTPAPSASGSRTGRGGRHRPVRRDRQGPIRRAGRVDVSRRDVHPRLAFGTVKGLEVEGKTIPAYTTIGGAFDHASHGDQRRTSSRRAGSRPGRSAGSGSTRLNNFISTADIIAATREARS